MRDGFGLLKPERDLPYVCDGLVDQGRYIGDDPVGYKCSRKAMWFDERGRLWCAYCYENPDRVQFIPPWGIDTQDTMIRLAVRSVAVFPKKIDGEFI